MRYALLDTLRGISVISMILYHTLWDLVYLYGVDIQWYFSSAGYFWQQSICWTFILISGFCQYLASKSLKDGIVISLSGIIVTLVSLTFESGAIIYGILTFIGLAILITLPLKRYYKTLPPLIFLIISFGLFAVTKGINRGYLGFGNLVLLDLPASLYPKHGGLIRTLIGFPARDFVSGDYFSLLPWYFLFTTGFFTASLMKRTGTLKHLKTPKIPVIDFLGRHALIIYLIHQPVIYLLLEIFLAKRV